jgi:hypothetical protein
MDELHPEGHRHIVKWNWANMFIGLMLLINNIIIVSVVFFVFNACQEIGPDIKKYFDNYVLHVSFA